MERLTETWQALSPLRRAALVAATLATLLAVALIANRAGTPRMALLYAGLEPAAAGEALAALEAMGVAHEARGTSVYVDARARDRARLALARDGLPRQGQAGYELLDEISGFSATADMFSAAYWRAREGELARTILAGPRVRSARVHLAVPARRPFARGMGDPSASVTVTTAGAPLAPPEAEAIRYLVALAVPSMAVDQVAVIDSRAGVVLAPGRGEGAAALGDRAAERETRMQSAIEALLAARVGDGNARVSVSVTLDRVDERARERRFDPDSRIVVSDDSVESSEQSEGGDPAVTVASNLPDGEAAGAPSQSQRSETRARANYDYNETQIERTRLAGGIARLSVAVLVNGIAEPQPDGTTVLRPRPDDELEALRALVRAAVGFDAGRGDVVTVESMAFQPPPTLGTEVEASGVAEFFDRNGLALVQLLVLAGVVLVIVFTVLRPLLFPQRDVSPVYIGPDAAALPGSTIEGETSAGEAGAGSDFATAATVGADAKDTESTLDPRVLHLPDRETLRRAVAELPDDSAATLRQWLDQGDEEAA
ncbi:MAG: flagellar basal-body MS-ring/collar protein FliF [Pseudomonadota bacterium]